MRKTLMAAAALAIAGIVLPAAPAHAAPAEVPCTPGTGGKVYCNFWVPGDGWTDGSPVVDGPVVGYLHKGRNWIICQQEGPETWLHDYPQWRNTWYAWTTAENGRTGWVNAVAASGGDNYGKFSNTPNCNGVHGSPF